MSNKSEDTPIISYGKLIVESKGLGVMVPINHNELDGLVGQLMQICDLLGDPIQRKALKDTIKRICRDWLDTEFSFAGYAKHTGLKTGATVINLDAIRNQKIKEQ